MQQTQLLLKAIDGIYETPTRPDRWPLALQRIAECFDGEGTFLVTQHADGSISSMVSPSLTACHNEYLQQWWRDDLLTQRSIEGGYLVSGNILTEYDLVTADEMAQLPFFRDFRRRYNLGGILAGSVAPHPNVTAALSIQRSLAARKLDERAMLEFENVLRHCERALFLACEIDAARGVQTTLSNSLARMGCGLFLLGSDETVRAANPAANGMLGNGIRLLRNQLHISDAAARAEYDSAVANLLFGMPEDKLVCAKPIIASRAAPLKPLIVHVLPLLSDEAASPWSLAGHVAGLVIITDPSASPGLDPAIVRDYLGLTMGEARIATQVGGGQSPREAAAHLSISEETVRTVLKRIFSKTGISRQSELSVLLGQLRTHSLM